MFCSACGQRVQDGTHFCQNCGAPLQASGAVIREPQAPPQRGRATQDPYKEQISQLKLEIKQLKLYLKQISTGMSSTRSQYYETAAFVPHGILRQGYKWLEDFRLWQPQQQKQHLQQQIMQLEQQLLGLQQAQLQWKAQRPR